MSQPIYSKFWQLHHFNDQVHFEMRSIYLSIIFINATNATILSNYYFITHHQPFLVYNGNNKIKLKTLYKLGYQ